jgi:hypothetical protein
MPVYVVSCVVPKGTYRRKERAGKCNALVSASCFVAQVVRFLPITLLCCFCLPCYTCYTTCTACTRVTAQHEELVFGQGQPTFQPHE